MPLNKPNQSIKNSLYIYIIRENRNESNGM